MKTGLIETRSGTVFIFRIHEEDEVHLMPIHSCTMRGPTYKVPKLPTARRLEFFDIDRPPATVSYQPILAPFT